MADQQFSGAATPEKDTLALQLRDDRGTVITEVTNFREYAFLGNYTTPTDGFNFVVGDEAVLRSLKSNVYVGQEVTLSVNGHVQAGGYIDRFKIKSSRSSGSEMHVEGRDWLSPAVDAEMDPRKTFQASNTLLDVIVEAFGPYGFGGIGQIITSDEANGNIITGQHRGLKTTKKGRPIKGFLAHQLKPYPHEGVFAFASRMSQRFGLWIDASADGQNLIVDEPDFTQKAIYELRNKLDDTGTNNLIESELDANAEGQPTVIVATGFGGGGDEPRTGMKVIVVNELFGLQIKSAGADGFVVRGRKSATPKAVQFVEKILGDNVGARVLDTRDDFDALPYFPRARLRVIYLHDDESKTPDELEFFARRELAIKQQHGFVYRTQLEGHTIAGVPVYTNTIANVDDDVTGLRNRMWCMSRSFFLSRAGGTTTKAEWILPFTLDFGT
jgi:prophage tail gpP-like protein